ncbi:MAG TPA: response regulator transcription factor [Gaiellaceae bacterium]|nr:response regulator transcription factor [Gaiellaceae bacterium]
MSGLPRCLVADDHPALVAAVADFLRESGFDVVATAPDGPGALAAAREHRPDAVLLDYRMPRVAGEELVRGLREAAPRAGIVVYTADGDDRLVAEALAAGAAGVVLKEAPLADVARAVRAVLAGGSYVDAALGISALTSRRLSSELTSREADVLALLAEGFTYEEIGRRLGISSETVRTHLQKASERLGASTRTHAVATAIRLGLIA